MNVIRRFATALCLLACLLGISAESDARGLTPWDVAQLESVGSVAISPDGQFVAYTVTVPRTPMEGENGRSWAELHVFDREQGESRAFITGDVTISSIQWTRDGQYIGYRAKREGDEKTAVYVIPVAGGESRRVLTWPTGISEFAFGPSGGRIAFTATEEESADQKARKKLGFNMEVYEENAKSWRLFVADVDLGAGSASEPHMLPIPDHVERIAWAATADRILATLAPTSRIDDEYMRRQWATIDIGTGEVIGRIQTEGKLATAAISADGERVALIGPDSINDPSAGRLMVAPATGGAPTILLGREFPGEVQAVRWLDDEELLILADEGVHSFVARISAGGSKLKKVVEDTHPLVTAIDVSADGKVIAARAESPSHPSELFTAKVGNDLERATDLNPWLAGIELATQRVIEWPARDGLLLQGVLVEPLNRVEGQRYPMIVSVHGGPEAHEKDGWKTSYSRVGQYAAAEGFAVFFPNYRGSTGRGVEFSQLSQGDPGGAEFDDVVDGVDYLIESGLVDEKRVGIMGGSYGGYATAWGATYYSDRYAAAAMFVGISEQYSKFGTTDIPLESQLVHQHPKKIFTDWQFFLERSPIYHAEGSETPLLILHGKDDTRVHPTQSMIMYRYFQQMADAPVRLVWYPGEGHGNRKAAARLDYSLRVMRWMNHYLVEGGTEMPDFEIDYEAEVRRMKCDAPGTLETLSAWMTGSFSSAEQAEGDEDYYDIRLEMARIWPEREDGVWLYVEQAMATHLDEPYRQRVYHVTDEGDGFASAVYSLESPLRFAGAYAEDAPLATLTPDSLSERDGCVVSLDWTGGVFSGSTDGDACTSSLRGASYATSEVEVYGDRILSWDRGFDAEGVHVWGAEKGGYVFLRKQD